MTALDVHLPVGAQPHIDDFAQFATQAEEGGFERVWMPETWGRDAVTTLATIAERTTTIGIGTSVVSVYSRSPTLLGQTAATLQEASSGRFRLGVGPSGPILMEGWHGITFEQPLRRTRETVEIIRQVQTGKMVDYDGEIFNLAGFRLRCGPPDPAAPIDIAGMGPKAVELAGRFGDGWHAIAFSRDGIRDRVEDLRKSEEKASPSQDRDESDSCPPCSFTFTAPEARRYHSHRTMKECPTRAKIWPVGLGSGCRKANQHRSPRPGGPDRVVVRKTAGLS